MTACLKTLEIAGFSGLDDTSRTASGSFLNRASQVRILPWAPTITPEPRQGQAGDFDPYSRCAACLEKPSMAPDSDPDHLAVGRASWTDRASSPSTSCNKSSSEAPCLRALGSMSAAHSANSRRARAFPRERSRTRTVGQPTHTVTPHHAVRAGRSDPELGTEDPRGEHDHTGRGQGTGPAHHVPSVVAESGSASTDSS